MSTDSFSSSTGDSHGAASPHLFTSVTGQANTDSPESPTVDHKLIRETRDQIRAMVDEITQLAQSDCSSAEFYQGFLTRATAALASIGGAIWRVDESGVPGLEYQINLAETGLVDDESAQVAHGRLLQQLAQSGDPELIQPRSGTDQDSDASNPTSCLLVVGPLCVDQKVVGLVEIFQRPGAGPTTQRGYLRFVVQMCKVASDYLRTRQLRQYARQQSQWHRMQSFVRAIHGSLDTRETAYAIANEGRHVLECDRVSVALPQGNRMQVQTMSGLDTIERRADQIKKLSQLATTVVRAGEPMHYAGSDDHLPPQIEKRLHEYLEVSHSKFVCIEPLREMLPPPESAEEGDPSQPVPGRIIGAIVAENLADDRPSLPLEERLPEFIGHSSDALTNAMAHSNMFLAPLWTWLGKTRVITSARNLPKTLTIFAAGLLIVAALFLIPRPFTLGATGKLVPEHRSEVFANIDGVLREIRVPDDPETIVQEGDVLAVMSNNDLRVEIENLRGELEKSREEVNKLKRAQHARMSPAEQRMIGGQLAEAEQRRDSLIRQLNLKINKAELLNVRAPADGRVINWQVRQNLLRRPVQRGQNLMTIVHPNTPWQVELEFPERRIAHLMRAQEQSDDPLKVTFTLASHPGHEYEGRLIEVDRRLDAHSDQGNAMLVRVAFSADPFPEDLLRSGTRVTAQVHAGTRSLGYVWFHELFETVHSTWLLWF